ncbi:hypothetical protein ACFX13_026762 [Malus domestica]|uniref:RNA helicase n=1 Tax=Malus domestica TaxID=3750 RepID=A0A498KH83_MALDO|nr:hypothetical protein DVH24_017806 [Malus domestica]
MTMPWSDSFTESTRNPTRRTLPKYIPRHLRNSEGGGGSYGYGYAPPTESPQYGFRQSYAGGPGRQAGRNGPGRGGGGRGRGRGGGRFWAQPPPNPTPDPNPFDNVSEEFDQLKVTEDEGDGNGGINFDAYEDIPVDASGEDIPPPVDTFVEIDLAECLNENIKRCKYVKPTPIQRHAIPIAMAGRDLMACAQTGSGKTAAFCFPIISGVLNNGVGLSPARGVDRGVCPSALILSPTRELAGQIHEEAKKFGYQSGVKIAVAYGGAPISQQLRILDRGCDILVATPGRLVDMIERSRVSLSNIKYLALDEADRMLDMGFEPQIRRIVEQMDMPRSGARQTLLFSATFPDEIQRLAADFLSNYIFLSVGRVGSSTGLIAQRVELVEDMDKRNHLMKLLSQQANGAHGKVALTLVFVETKRSADSLENWLRMNRFPAIAIHGDKVQMEREQALRLFKCGKTPILVATDVASRGLDIPHVSHVINFDLPKSIDDYVHRIGRTGRAGNSGLATAFFNAKNQPLAKGLIELMQESNQEVPSWLNEYAEGESQTYSSGGGGGRNRRSGGSKFGGYDYRRDSQYAHDSYYGPSSYGYGDYSGGMSAAPYNDAASVPNGYGNYETIVAGGWD